MLSVNGHDRVDINPGQQRKLRIIEKSFGPTWPEVYPGMAVDAVYNIAIKDNRKSLFCKIDPVKKDKLAEMLEIYGITMGDFIGSMIDKAYEVYAEQCRARLLGIANEYSGP
jgi:hypothetical protein